MFCDVFVNKMSSFKSNQRFDVFGDFNLDYNMYLAVECKKNNTQTKLLALGVALFVAIVDRLLQKIDADILEYNHNQNYTLETLKRFFAVTSYCISLLITLQKIFNDLLSKALQQQHNCREYSNDLQRHKCLKNLV